MKINKKLTKLLLALAVVPFTLLTFTTNSQHIHADTSLHPTFHHSDNEGTAKEIYEDTGLTKKQYEDNAKHDANADKATQKETNQPQRAKTQSTNTNHKKTENKPLNKKVSHKKVSKRHKNHFYTQRDLKKGHRTTIKVLKPMMAHKNISFKKNHSDNKVRKNQHLKVIKVRKFKNVYRFQLNNHKFVTSNKSFVRILK